MKIDRVNDAIKLASILHEKQYRKAGNVPYISHPYAVGLVLTMAGCKEDVIIAGILHDTVEDSEYTLNELEIRFGKEVAHIVRECTEEDKTKSWKERKNSQINRIKDGNLEVKYVKLADLLHNLKSLYECLEKDENNVWESFNASKEEIKWYYDSMIEALNSNVEESSYILLYNELKIYYELVFNR